MPTVKVEVVNNNVVEVAVKPNVIVVGAGGGGECNHQKYLGEYEVVT